MTITPWPNELVRDIALWLQEHRKEPYDHKHAVVSRALSGLSREELLHYAASNFLVADVLLVASQRFPEMRSGALDMGARARGNVEARKRVGTSKAATDVRHKINREKNEGYKLEWLSGIYRTKTSCAETISSRGGVSHQTIINALKGVPKPDPWPAREK